MAVLDEGFFEPPKWSGVRDLYAAGVCLVNDVPVIVVKDRPQWAVKDTLFPCMIPLSKCTFQTFGCLLSNFFLLHYVSLSFSPTRFLH